MRACVRACARARVHARLYQYQHEPQIGDTAFSSSKQQRCGGGGEGGGGGASPQTGRSGEEEEACMTMMTARSMPFSCTHPAVEEDNLFDISEYESS